MPIELYPAPEYTSSNCWSKHKPKFRIQVIFQINVFCKMHLHNLAGCWNQWSNINQTSTQVLSFNDISNKKPQQERKSTLTN